MSRSKNSRKGHKYVRGCLGCSQCDSNWVERHEPLVNLEEEIQEYEETTRRCKYDESCGCSWCCPSVKDI